MSTLPHKILLFLLRLLVYLKRAIVWCFRIITRIAKHIGRVYRQTIGFRLYKVSLVLHRSTGGDLLLRRGQILDRLMSRTTLQWIMVVLAIGIMIPQSKAYTQSEETIPGQKTLLYKLVGPGEEETQLEEVEPNVNVVPKKPTRSWQDTAAVANGIPVNEGEMQLLANQNLPRVMLGGSAMSKPIIFPGAPETGVSLPPVDRQETIEYIVKEGDTIGSIAKRHHVNVATILVTNGLSARSYIRPGDHLRILPVSGVMHHVKRGDTLARIARLYGVGADEIAAFNRLSKQRSLPVGSDLIIPNGIAPPPKPSPRVVPHDIVETPIVPEQISEQAPEVTPPIETPAPSSEIPLRTGFIWPTAVHRITQYFSWRHTGVDIAGPIGTPVYAAKRGTVVRSQCGWNGGYGCHIIIDHGDGIQTLYGHASQLLVSEGDTVEQGQTIALMGSTGHSSGPHCHFEVRANARRVNPLKYIR